MESSDRNKSRPRLSGKGEKDSPPFQIKSKLSEEEIRTAEKNTWDVIRKQTIDKAEHKRGIRRRIFWASSAAAVLLAFFALNPERFFYESRLEWKTFVVPMGKTDSLWLGDGSVVYLNGGSTLWYPVEFEKSQRLVKLSGEGYFQVTGNRQRPFIVKTDPIDVRVLGTTFNVKAYPEDKSCEVLLETGRVRVEGLFLDQAVELSPDDLLIYQVADNSYKKEVIDPASALAWRSGDYHFRSASLAEIFKTLERGFGVRFIVEDPVIGDKKLRTSVTADKNIYENLDNLKIIGDFNYRIKEKDTIVIYK